MLLSDEFRAFSICPEADLILILLLLDVFVVKPFEDEEVTFVISERLDETTRSFEVNLAFFELPEVAVDLRL